VPNCYDDNKKIKYLIFLHQETNYVIYSSNPVMAQYDLAYY